MTLLIRTDASLEIGTGHVMRCLALAQAWVEAKGEPVTFLMANTTPALESQLAREGFHIAYLSLPPGSEEDAEQTVVQANALCKAWLVVDGYQFGADYQRKIKAAGLKLLFIDDYGHAEQYRADFVLNQNMYAYEGLYANRESYSQLLLGTRYVLLRKEFWPWRDWQRQFPTVACKILVTLGGADQDNVTLKVVQALQLFEVKGLEAVIIIGGSNPHYEQLQSAILKTGMAITLQQNVTNMPELMAWADIAISAGGTTAYELAYMSLPSLLIVLANNQEAVAEILAGQQLSINLGWHDQMATETLAQALKNLLESQAKREDMARRSRQLVDGLGCARVISCLRTISLHLRLVTRNDIEIIWQWANDPEVRSVSLNPQMIPWKQHCQWFENKLRDSDCYWLIAVNDQHSPIGQVRFDLPSKKEAIINISLDKNQRGLGIGSKFIRQAVCRLFQETSVQIVNAYIKQSNMASIRTFQKAGFEKVGVNLIQGQLVWQYRIVEF